MSDTDARLEKIELKLDRISETLGQIAIQRDRLDRTESQVQALWQRWDGLVAPEGALTKISHHQASCPREQIRFLWIVVIPMGLTLLGLAFAVIKNFI